MTTFTDPRAVLGLTGQLEQQLTHGTPFRLLIAGGTGAALLGILHGLNVRPSKDLDLFICADTVPGRPIGHLQSAATLQALDSITERAGEAGWQISGPLTREAHFYHVTRTYEHPELPGVQLIMKCEGMEDPRLLIQAFDIPEHKAGLLTNGRFIDLRHRGWLTRPPGRFADGRTYAARILKARRYGYYVEPAVQLAAEIVSELDPEHNTMYLRRTAQGEATIKAELDLQGIQTFTVTEQGVILDQEGWLLPSLLETQSALLSHPSVQALARQRSAAPAYVPAYA